MRDRAAARQDRHEGGSGGELFSAAWCAAACDTVGLPDDGEAPIVVACSGGQDSAAALDVVRRGRPHARLIACYVDHGVRSRASIERDIDAVRRQAAALRAALRIAKLPQPVGQESGEAALREARYAALRLVARRAGARHVVTGQHADDVAETVLLGLIRGSGLDGLTAMPARRPLGGGAYLARPLAAVSKRACEARVLSLGLPISIDETNADPRFRRNAVRKLLRAVDAIAPNSLRAIARSAALLAEDRRLLDALTLVCWRRCLASERSEDISCEALRKLPLPLMMRVVRHALRRHGNVRDFHYEHCRAIVQAVAQGRGGSFHAGACSVVLSAGRLCICGRTPRKDRLGANAGISVPARAAAVRFAGGTLFLRRVKAAGEKAAAPRSSNGELRSWLDGAKFPPGSELLVRSPSRGDKCIPSGRHSPVSLMRFLAKSGVPKHLRDDAVILCAGGRIAAVLGLRTMQGYQPTAGKKRLEVRFVTKQPTVRTAVGR